MNNHEHIMKILVELIEFNGELHSNELTRIITDFARFIKNNNCFVDKGVG